MNQSRFNPQIHHRQTTRLKDYDYTQEGAYFITICTEQRACLFGDISDTGVLQPSAAGEMVMRWWRELPRKFLVIAPDVAVAMPNHFHGVLFITQSHAVSLSRIMQWFKTMTTNEYIRGVKQKQWPPFAGRVWQRNYYDHIVRDEQALQKIRTYISNNPMKWALDREHPNSPRHRINA